MADAGPIERKPVQVLVVDDDEAVRRVAVRQLTALGYGVTSCGSGAEALSTLAGRDDIDLLLVDVSMPGGLSGPEVAQRATARQPGLRVLFASGQYDTSTDDAHLIVKPYRKQDLARKLEEILHAPPS